MAGDQRDELVGTWRLVAAESSEEVKREAPPGKVTWLKHVTATQFTWLEYDSRTKQLVRALGGSYVVKDDTYNETYRYYLGAGQEESVGKEDSFSWEIKDGKWYTTSSFGTTVWERVK